ncbi:hypothetical protein ACH9EU_04280 [Kocuria sp. M1R5S2]|uniref:hypothetical protein n=1 Tax=Kocuria rhizosphaerae TaxID=3376285 RepID=UPI0037A5B591
MTQIAPQRRESLAEAADKLMTENADGTYSIRIPYEDDRIVTVQDKGNARVIARAAAARMRVAEL